MVDDNIQHGIDDDPNNDAEKGAALGGAGGAVTGAIGGAVLGGPVGAIVGAVGGALLGGGASGLAVGAVDKVDNDNTVTGLGTGVTPDVNTTTTAATVNAVTPGNSVPGVQTGGYAVDGTPDTRGVSEKVADAVTGDPYDDKTGKPVV